MKYAINKPPGFTPVDVTLTFESQLELDTLTSLFNVTKVCEAIRRSLSKEPSYGSYGLNKDIPTLLRQAFEQAGGNPNVKYEVIHKEIHTVIHTRP